MSNPTLTEEQLEQLWNTLPRELKRRLTARFEQELAQERRLRQQAFYDQLRDYARKQGVDWEMLSPEVRAAFIHAHREQIAQIDNLFTRFQPPVESALRSAAAQRGLDWDSLDDDARLAFVEEWLRE